MGRNLWNDTRRPATDNIISRVEAATRISFTGCQAFVVKQWILPTEFCPKPYGNHFSLESIACPHLPRTELSSIVPEYLFTEQLRERPEVLGQTFQNQYFQNCPQRLNVFITSCRKKLLSHCYVSLHGSDPSPPKPLQRCWGWLRWLRHHSFLQPHRYWNQSIIIYTHLHYLQKMSEPLPTVSARRTQWPGVLPVLAPSSRRGTSKSKWAICFICGVNRNPCCTRCTTRSNQRHTFLYPSQIQRRHHLS
jgi:hypothetical protein